MRIDREGKPVPTERRNAKMVLKPKSLLVVVMVSVGLFFGNIASAGTVERGRYVTKIAGCNDCHTQGYLLSDGKVPESSWLAGDNFGWRGPWGTTYGSNLRLFMAGMTEKRWIAAARTLKRRPTMPWFNLNVMKDEDLKGIYQFVRSLGPAGAPAPAYVPPGQEPKTPYALFPTPPK
jgi:hypothetical protein